MLKKYEPEAQTTNDKRCVWKPKQSSLSKKHRLIKFSELVLISYSYTTAGFTQLTPWHTQKRNKRPTVVNSLQCLFSVIHRRKSQGLKTMVNLFMAVVVIECQQGQCKTSCVFKCSHSTQNTKNHWPWQHVPSCLDIWEIPTKFRHWEWINSSTRITNEIVCLQSR